METILSLPQGLKQGKCSVLYLLYQCFMYCVVLEEADTGSIVLGCKYNIYHKLGSVEIAWVEWSPEKWGTNFARVRLGWSQNIILHSTQTLLLEGWNHQTKCVCVCVFHISIVGPINFMWNFLKNLKYLPPLCQRQSSGRATPWPHSHLGQEVVLPELHLGPRGGGK